jgi:hypothetical protein
MMAAAKCSPLLDGEIEETTSGLQTSYSNRLRSMDAGNAATVVEYIAAMKSEINLSDNYRRSIIEVLTMFSRSNDNKSFRDLTRINTLS